MSVNIFNKSQENLERVAGNIPNSKVVELQNQINVLKDNIAELNKTKIENYADGKVRVFVNNKTVTIAINGIFNFGSSNWQTIVQLPTYKPQFSVPYTASINGSVVTAGDINTNGTLELIVPSNFVNTNITVRASFTYLL